MKKLFLPLVTLIIGLVAGYLVCKSSGSHSFDDEKQAFIEKTKMTFKDVPATVITNRVTIKRMRQEFLDESRGLMYGQDGQKSLKGYYVDRDDLDSLLKHKEFTGISVNFGKHPDYLGLKDRVYTLMLMGAIKKNKTDKSYVDVDDKVYDHVEICPDVCGTF
jgi:hypothetical protein